MQRIICLILLGFMRLMSSSQTYSGSGQANLDSLKRLLSGSEIGQKIEILNSLAYQLAPYNFDSSIMYSSQAMRLATQNGFQKEIGVARYNLGNAYYFKMDFKNALVSYLSAQSLLEKGPYDKELGDVCLMLGHINFFIKKGVKAINYYHKAIEYYQAAGSESSIASVFSSMSLTMSFLNYGPIDSAILYGIKWLDYSRKYHNRSLEAEALANIGMFYTGENKSVEKKQKALPYCDSALTLATELNNDGIISVININIGGFYDRSSPLFEFTGDLTLSRNYYEKAYLAALKIKSSYLQAIILNYLAEIDIEEGKYEMAEKALNQSEARLNDFFRFEWRNNPVSDLNSFGRILEYFLAQRERNAMYIARFKLAMARKEFGKAVEYQQLYYQSTDSLNAEQQGRQLELLMAEDEAERQDQKLLKLAQDNEMNQLKLSRSRFIFISGGVGLVLLSVVLLLLIQRRKLRAERQSVLMEQRLLRTQMNPHFIFNSLASIQNFVINENSDKASIYLSRFSQLIRNILDNSVEEYVPIEKEISTIENYLELQKVRYAGKFDYRITVDEQIDEENMLIPPMLAQPFIENAIEHGIRHKKTSGNIEIRFQLIGGLIKVEVEDDGVGREKAQQIESKQTSRHRSMAISITHDRLEAINKKLKNKIRMEIIDLIDDSGEGIGTRVEFGIPVVTR